MPRTKSPVRPLNQTPTQVAEAAKAEKARKVASRAALKAAKTQADATLAAPVVETQQIATEPASDPVREERKQADTVAFLQTLREDAVAFGAQTDQQIAAYVREQGVDPVTGALLLPERQRYNGPMLALVAARKSYVKAANGNPCNGSPLALLCGQYSREVVVAALIDALKLSGNPYAHLNPGQQSMNLRNKARHALNELRLSLGEVEAHLKAHATKA